MSDNKAPPSRPMGPDDPRAVRFRRAVEDGDAPAIRRLVEAHPDLRGVLDAPWFAFGAPALVFSTNAQNREVIDALLDLGADPNAKSDWAAGPYSALDSIVDASAPVNVELAEHLIERGATLDIHAAAGLGRIDVLATILDAHPERVSEPGPDGATPLHLAMNVETADFLLERGAEIDKRCVDHKSTPAMWSVMGREPVTRFLLQRGARPDLFMAAVLDDVDLAWGILEQDPGAIDVRVRFGQSHEHVGFGDKYVWALDFADTPLEVARRRGHEAVYAFLLERSEWPVKLLHACRRGDLAEVDLLLGDHRGSLAALSGNEIVGLLGGTADAALRVLRAGADPDVRDEDNGATAMHYASWRGERDLVRVLLEHGADPFIRDSTYSATPLGWAYENGRRGMVNFLLEHHSLDIVDAAWMGDARRVAEILRRDPTQVDGPDDSRASPLRSAAWHGHREVVAVLLSHGADRRIPHPETGKTALDLAAERGHQDVVALLRG